METNGTTTTRPGQTGTVSTKVTLTLEAAKALSAIQALESVGAYDGPTETEIISAALIEAIAAVLGKK